MASAFVVPFIFATVIAFACAQTAGRSLGLFFGPLLLLTFVVPQIFWVTWAGTPARPVASTAQAEVPAHATQNWSMVPSFISTFVGLLLPIVLVWLFYSRVDATSVLYCAVISGAWILTLLGLAMLLSRTGIAPVLACAIVVVLAIAWLTWPVWLSHELPTSRGQWIIRWLAPINPLLAINGVLRERFDMWDRYRIAYQHLTTLNQDVIYTLPRSIWPSVVVDAAIGVAGLILGTSRSKVLPVPSPAVVSSSGSAGEGTGGGTV